MHGAAIVILVQASAPPVAPAIVMIEEALVEIVRTATLPALHGKFLHAAGVMLEGSAYPLLRVIGEQGPLRLRELAADQGIDQSTVSRHVARLEAHGLVHRASDASDGRAVVVSLTTAGHDVMDRLRAVRHRAFAEMLGHWSSEERDALAPLLIRLAEEFRGLGRPK